MSSDKVPWQARRHRKRGVYYRIEIFDETSVCWKDAPGTFDTSNDAQAAIRHSYSDRKARVMQIDGAKREVLG